MTEALTFTAADVQAITGVSTGLQREWRRQGILPKNEGAGWTRASIQDVVLIFILKQVADAGFPLREAQKVSGEAAPSLMGMLRQMAAGALQSPSAGRYELYALPDAKFWPLLQCEIGASPAEGEPKRYLILSREGTFNPDAPAHVVPRADLADVPDNLTIVTALDNRRAAERILEGIRTVLEARGGAE